MTATPMQIHPVEVWDLLKLLGLGAGWGADEHNFLGFFGEMRKSYETIDWDLVFNLVGDYLETGGQIDPTFSQEAVKKLGPVQWSILKGLPSQKSSRKQSMKQLNAAAKPFVIELARRHTPLQHYIFRNTRSLLREYFRKGLLKENVPTRRPEIERIQMRADEQELYRRIEEYIAHFYQKYEQERRGLGFIMTVYRRRLTSSFYAVRQSLERRLKYLRGEVGLESTLTIDDTEQDELEFDWGDDFDEDDPRSLFKAEVDYLVDFIRELRELSQADSKLERLKKDLNTIFHQRSTALVFTQYTDTMDYLRDDLQVVYGSAVACYSGRGGEMWDGKQWVLVSKEIVKADFKEGKIRILLCTDSASEGLNLQTCGVLFIYDSGFNPMRHEQKIGRIDRIGQVYAEIWIRIYFYCDTIEDVIFQRLKDRINWFEVVVGDLQPILAEVGDMTQRLAMLPADQRAAQLELAVKELEQHLQNRQVEALNLDSFAQVDDAIPSLQTPLNLSQLSDILLNSPLTANYFQPSLDIQDAYRLKINDLDLPVTFSTACIDEHPTRVQLLTYGNPVLDELLAQVAPPEINAGSRLARLCSPGEPEYFRWIVNGSNGQVETIETISELQTWLHEVEKMPVMSSAGWDAPAQTEFESEVQKMRQKEAEVIRMRQVGVYLAEKARAQRLLIKAALVELVLGQRPELFASGNYPAAFNSQAVRGLARHKYPWGALIMLAFDDGLIPSADDPYFKEIQASSVDSLKGRFNQLKSDAAQQVKTLADTKVAV